MNSRDSHAKAKEEKRKLKEERGSLKRRIGKNIKKLKKIKAGPTDSEKGKKKLKREYTVLKDKLKKKDKSLKKVEIRLEELNEQIRKFKKKFSKKAKDQEKKVKKSVIGKKKEDKKPKEKLELKKAKKKRQAKKKAGKKNISLIPVGSRALLQPGKTIKTMVSTPSKALREVKDNKKDNLQLISGIGPKTVQVLNDSGIFSFKQLAQTNEDKLNDILKAHFRNWKMFTTFTWPEQAILADAGKFDVLKQLQDKLKEI